MSVGRQVKHIYNSIIIILCALCAACDPSSAPVVEGTALVVFTPLSTPMRRRTRELAILHSPGVDWDDAEQEEFIRLVSSKLPGLGITRIAIASPDVVVAVGGEAPDWDEYPDGLYGIYASGRACVFTESCPCTDEIVNWSANVAAHEIGHALGWTHTTTLLDIMNIANPQPLVCDADLQFLTAPE